MNDRSQPAKRLGAAQVYAQLRELILSFELYPGSRVTETELAERFQVSRTPVREALQRLETEGYLSVRPKQGVFIRQLDVSELAQYYRVRVALELTALDIVCATVADRVLKEIAAAWNPDTQPGRSDDFVRMAERDEEFHIQLAEVSGNQVLAAYLRDINHRIRVIRRLDFTDNGRVDTTYAEHHAIVQSLLARDLERARRLMQAHINASERFAKTVTLTQLARRRPLLSVPVSP